MVLSSPLARRIRRNRRLRPLGIAAYRVTMRLRPGGNGPRVIANSIPKAGTHLLMSTLDAVPGLRFSGMHFGYGELTSPEEVSARRRLADLDKAIGRLGTAQYMMGHIRCRPEVVALLAARGCRNLVCIRDPRDIALSWAMFLKSNTRHPLHARLMATYPDFDDLLQVVITGAPSGQNGGPNGPELPSLSNHLDRYLGWLDEPDSCVVRYEDLIGPRGGGSEDAQLAAVERILQFIGAAKAEQAAVADSVYSTTSATFRRGQIGSWRAEMPARHQALIQERCGDQLQALGYSG